ncbi:MAG TPA: hypothetical protein VHY30_08900 [Verrucomicrobiae bacterium]|jgi:hypothetical protein|nr:hypothetical protein [Verrucomicrobiae bacterium]
MDRKVVPPVLWMCKNTIIDFILMGGKFPNTAHLAIIIMPAQPVGTAPGVIPGLFNLADVI